MPERRENSEWAACSRWEALLADAEDGQLKSGDEAGFTAHMAACRECAALFEAARRGRQWLEFLEAEPGMPAGLEERILARTGPGHETAYPAVAPEGGVPAGQLEPWEWGGAAVLVRRFAEPRLMLTVAMAFFSIALTLKMTAPRLAGVSVNSLRPAAMRSYMERQLAMASVPVLRYYDHLRLVNEVQSAVREMNPTPEGAGSGERV